jgi:hypothetical protein
VTAIEMARAFESKGTPWYWDAREETLVAIAEVRLYQLPPMIERLVSDLDGRVNEFNSDPYPIDLLRSAERKLTTAAREEASRATGADINAGRAEHDEQIASESRELRRAVVDEARLGRSGIRESSRSCPCR